MNKSFFARKLPITQPWNTQPGTGLIVFQITRTRPELELTTQEGTQNLLFFKILLNFIFFPKNRAFYGPS